MDAQEQQLLRTRMLAMLWRIPAVVAGLVALFWGVWHLIADEVPSVSNITFGPAHQLSFAISRWFDIPAAAVFAGLGVLAWYFTKKLERSDHSFVFAAFAFAFTFAFAATSFAPAFTFAAGIIITFAFTAVNEYKEGVAMGVIRSVFLAFGIGLGSSILLGGIIGLGSMVVLAVAYAILSVLVFSAVYGVKFAVRERRRIIRSVVDWMLAHDC